MSVFTGTLLILTIITLLIRWLCPESIQQGLGIGALWVGLAITFEVLHGRS